MTRRILAVATVMLLTNTAAQAETRAMAPETSAKAAADRAAQTTETAGAAIERLSARLAGAPSATAVLEAWCAERGMAAEARLVAQRVPGIVKPIAPAQRARLAIGLEEPVAYRRVRLSCGAYVLSEADNWYVPSRLTPEMNAVLATTDAPFGRVVRPLAPRRQNLSHRRLWTGAPEESPGFDAPVLALDAVLSTAEGVPFCEVAETYKGAVLARGSL